MTSASSDLLWLRICCLPLREAASAVVCCVTFSMSQSCRGHLPRIPTVLYQRASPAVFILFITRPQLQEAPRRRQRQRSKSSENFVEREHEPAHDSWAPTRAAAEFLLRSFFFFPFSFFPSFSSLFSVFFLFFSFFSSSSSYFSFFSSFLLTSFSSFFFFSVFLFSFPSLLTLLPFLSSSFALFCLLRFLNSYSYHLIR